MLLLLLSIMTVIMLVCMGMSIVQVRAEEKTKAGIVWIALSCFSIFMVVGISYLMLKAPVVAGETVALSQEVSSAPSKEKSSSAATGTSSGKSDADASREAMKTLSSYSYLIDVLEALKKGEPIPEKYLQLLPESVRKQILESQQKTGGQQAGGTSHSGSPKSTVAVVTAPSSQATATSGTSNSQSGSLAGSNKGASQTPADSVGANTPVQSPPQQQPTQQTSNQPPAQQTEPTVPPAAQPSPVPATKPALSAASWISQVLYRDRAAVRGKLQNALPLQQGTDKDLYLTGDMILEVRYANDQAVTLIMVMERLVPAGQSREYWKGRFRQIAGMDDSAPTSSDGLVTVWDGVYDGVAGIQFVIDLDNNRGLIQAW